MNRLLLSTALSVALVAAVAAATTFSGVAGASENEGKCNVPVAEHQSRDVLKKKLEGEGWKVRRIKNENGCYEVYGWNAKGRRVEAYFNPKTFDAMMPEMDD